MRDSGMLRPTALTTRLGRHASERVGHPPLHVSGARWELGAAQHRCGCCHAPVRAIKAEGVSAEGRAKGAGRSVARAAGERVVGGLAAKCMHDRVPVPTPAYRARSLQSRHRGLLEPRASHLSRQTVWSSQLKHGLE